MFFGVGWRPSPPSLSSPSLIFLFLQITHKSLVLCTTDGQTHGVALEAEEAIAASARRFAQSIPTCLASRKQKRFTNATSRYGRMRKCEGISKAEIKAKRAHAEI
jgi:hypothetical protein